MGLYGHEYEPPSSRSPGLLMFLVDKSLYNQSSNLMPVLSKQVGEICKRFSDSDKEKLFRLVVCDFANAPQRRNHASKTVDLNDIIYLFGAPKKPFENLVFIEGGSSYKIDRWVEDFDAGGSDGIFVFGDNATVTGTNLKAVLDGALDEVNYHHSSLDNGNQPPISILMFTGNAHDKAQDYDRKAGDIGMDRSEKFHQRKVDSFVEYLLKNDNVLLAVFNMYGKSNDGDNITIATHFTEEMLTKAMEAEIRYLIPHDERIESIFDDPNDELIGKPFIFNQDDIEDKPKFLAAMIRLGTSTVLDTRISNKKEDEEEGDRRSAWK